LTPLPGALGGQDLIAWRLDQWKHRETWDSGEGAYLGGGRWNGKGIRAVYCAVDPATAILEVAVHKGFKALDTVPHALTSFRIADPKTVHIVDPAEVSNPNWLKPGLASAGQQEFGNQLLARSKYILVPSVVSEHSWNLVFVATVAKGTYVVRSQERFALDTRLHPPVIPTVS
jgi:RES domain-containing protein